MVEDIVREFGFLTLGSRLKRIGERLQADTQRIIDEMGVTLQASQYPFLAALDRLGPLTIGELAEAVGHHPAGRHARRLAARQARPGQGRPGRTTSGAGSSRSRRKGERARRRFGKREVWPRIEDAVADLCGGLSGPLLEQLAAIEDGLAALPLDRRAHPRQGRRTMTHVLDRPGLERAHHAARGARRRRRPRPALPARPSSPSPRHATTAPRALRRSQRFPRPGESMLLAAGRRDRAAARACRGRHRAAWCRWSWSRTPAKSPTRASSG